jgi:glycosyl transferase family 25
MVALDVYLINLIRHPERAERIKALLGPTPLNLHCIAAADGVRLRDRQGPAPSKIGALPSDRALSRFEIALILSHRRAWRRFLRTEASRCVVIEDDVYFGEGFAAFVENPALGNCEFDVVKLEAFGATSIVTSQRYREIDGRRVARLLSTHMGSAGYMITRAAAKRLLVLSAGAPAGMDSILFDFGRMRASRLRPLRIGQVLPAPIIQHDVRSDVPPGASLLNSIIGDQRGRKLGSPRATPRRFLREISRPFEQLWLRSRARAVEFH